VDRDSHVQRRQTNGGLVGSCTRDARESGVNRSWRDEHLANAWPILVPREPGESVQSWRERLVTELDETRAKDERLSSALGERMAVKSGELYPANTENNVAASQRVEVPEHQLAEAPFERLGGPV
jgi:predicted DNA-binding ribbon-helix-helix protein